MANKLPVFEANYVLSIAGVDIAQEKRQLTHYRDGYLFSSQAKTIGLANLFKPYSIKASSYFVIKNEVFYTKHYQLIKKSGKKIKQTIDLVASSQTVINQTTGQSYPIHSGGIIDKLNLFIVLSNAIANDKGTKTLSYQIMKKNQPTTYTFTNHGRQTKTLNDEVVNIIKLTRNDKDNKRPLEIWLDPKQSFIPVYVEQVEKGKTYRYTLENDK